MSHHNEILDIYRRRAKRNDFTANLYYLVGFREWAYRRKAINALGLSRGDTVVEIGCGTGLNFELIQQAVGSEGTIIGVDLTDEMLRQAQARIDRKGWGNVELVECDASTYHFPNAVHGILSTFALTLIPSFDAIVERGSKALRDGKRLVVADLKMPNNFLRYLYPLLLPIFRPFGVTLDLQSRHPWESIEQYLGNVSIDEYFLGFTYIAMGKKSQKASARASGD
ncbi:class I SAM-dependent methyltransferase [Botrimarina mediterranea]|uniref:class I SAM-dependent methyltransferase n=1 Tax=Botrimarina mediterranea TaxID=2528022 RepID=UPI001188B2A1|nr:Demethylmenaquinone methyltransferase [Planctomycetes bacterium K2D]